MKYLCLLFLILFTTISAQTEVKGFVLTETGQPVSKANIILLNEQEQIETFIFSQKDGSFFFSLNKIGNFKLQFTALGYISQNINISFKNQNDIIHLDNTVLESDKIKEIKEVIIKKTTPIKLKKDTVEYKVQNFSNGSEQNVEELLKKLPGISIQSDGKIKFGNKEVDRVMVENDDLFESGYQTLTKNMPSKPLDKVQVLKNYSKNKLLKNIEDSESIAINLTLKDDAKNKWFGNILLGSTSYIENMYQAKVNLMNFSKRKKIYLLANANNLGANEMKGVEYLINPSSDNDVENIGSSVKVLSIANLHQKNNQFDEKRTNFNNDKLVSLNYIYNFKNDWKLKFVTIFNDTENRNYIDNYYKFSFNNINFTNIEKKSWKLQNRNLVGKLELIKSFKDNSNIQFYNKISSLKEYNDNSFDFNEQQNSQNGDNRLFTNENKLVYTKKIDSSKAFVGVAKFIYQNRPYNFTDENDVFQYLIGNPNAARINQVINSKMNFGGVKLSYLKKYSGEKTLEIQIGDEVRNDFLNSNLSLYDINSQPIIDFDKSIFINNIDYSQNNLFGQIKYKKRNDRWSYGVSLLNQLISSNLNSAKNLGFYLSPNFNIGYENKNIGNFNFFASRKFSTISVNDVYVNYIYQGNRSFKQSDLGFQVLPDYNLGFTYTFGDMLSEYVNLLVNYSRSNNYISTNMIVNPNYIFNQNILVKNNNTLFSNLEIRKYLKSIKSRISLLGSYMLSEYENSINNQALIQTRFSNAKIGFEMKSGWTAFVSYELGYEWIFNRMQSDTNSNKYIDKKGFFNLYFSVNPRFKIESNFEYYKFGNTNQKATQFLDVKMNYNIKKYNMNLFLQGNNLLNSNSVQRYSIDNISESLYTQKLLPLHIIFGVNKNF